MTHAILARLLNDLTSLHTQEIDLNLVRVERLMEKLGNPHLRMPPVFHVAGTNGKGSTVAYLRACLEATGKRVHVYTSPHLVCFNERIRLAGQFISDDDLVSVLRDVRSINGDDPITFFEVTTAAAFLAFSRVPADAVVLEVGMGGRLDATNIVPRPAVCGIAQLAIDHQQF
jgi:dihydrofolate synthase / folylpolyglutamate synthase